METVASLQVQHLATGGYAGSNYYSAGGTVSRIISMYQHINSGISDPFVEATLSVERRSWTE